MMGDAQGQTYWQRCREEDFTLLTGDARWDDDANALMLASRLANLPDSVTPATTRNAAAHPAITVDAYGSWARVVRQGATDRIMAGGATEPETEIYQAPVGTRIAEIAATTRDWLVILLDDGRVVVRDLLERFPETELTEPGFSPDRVAETADGTFWLLDRTAKQLRRLEGNPLPDRVRRRRRAEHVFQPEPLDSDPLRLTLPLMGDLSGAGENFIDMVALPDGRVAILSLGAGRASLLRLTDGEGMTDAIPLGALQSAFSLSHYGDDKLALLVPGAENAVMVRLLEDDQTRVMGTLLPLRRGTGGRLCKTLPGAPVAYPAAPRTPPMTDPPRPFARLVAPSRPSYARSATARTTILEADQPGTIWHRAYLDAHIPVDCGITLLMAAGDDLAALEALPTGALYAHRFGTLGPDMAGPRGVWLEQDSERPWLSSATGQTRKRDRCGLFSILIQKTGTTVKRIAGRFLRIDIVIDGPGLSTPRLYALRVWGARRAWRDRFLPDYLSVEEGPMAEGSDFLDRSLALFESVLTPIEDEVGASYRLTRPDAVPTDALEWLANWIGAELDSALSEAAKRRLLGEAVQLWRRRGTLPGLEKMLDIVTEGGVARGDLVVLEHYHLRRTFATILGADLSDADNPLTPWAAQSGNSHLGATFFLGDEDRKAFFALFRPDLLNDPLTSETERLDALDDLSEFFDNHAFRITVLVHADMDQSERDLIARVLDREVPAHIVATMVDGPGSLVLALSSLVGVDSRFGRTPPLEPLTIATAEIGQAFLTDLPSLEDRKSVV